MLQLMGALVTDQMLLVLPASRSGRALLPPQVLNGYPQHCAVAAGQCGDGLRIYAADPADRSHEVTGTGLGLLLEQVEE